MKKFSPSVSRTTCGSLLKELQVIWDEIGEADADRDQMLLDLEQECLNLYRKKVENSKKYKSDLKQTISESSAEIRSIISALGEQISFPKVNGTLKEQLCALSPALEDLRLKKQQRVKEFSETQAQIICICAEISGNDQRMSKAEPQIDEQDLTFSRLEELKSHLEDLRKEKAMRSQKVSSYTSAIHELAATMSMDFKETVIEVHPSLVDNAFGHSKSISNETLAKLSAVADSLRQEKQRRLQKIQDLGIELVDLWRLLDIPSDQQKRFADVTHLIYSTADGVSKHGCLSLELIEQVDMEVDRLSAIKTTKMKELILKRQQELEEIYDEVHMDVDIDGDRQSLISLVESGKVDLSELLSRLDDQIIHAKEVARSKKEVLERVDKWSRACEEETWLDEYEKDDNRYSAGRGAHKNLKRAEKARVLAGKIPSLVENLTSKVKAWETENETTFFYNKAPLLKTLEEYLMQRQQREEEKRRSREQKRHQEQLATEKEAIFGRASAKKPLGQNNSNNNVMVGTPARRTPGVPSASGRLGFSSNHERRESGRSTRAAPPTPVNYVSLPPASRYD